MSLDDLTVKGLEHELSQALTSVVDAALAWETAFHEENDTVSTYYASAVRGALARASSREKQMQMELVQAISVLRIAKKRHASEVAFESRATQIRDALASGGEVQCLGLELDDALKIFDKDGMSPRLANGLSHHGIRTVDTLAMCTEQEILAMRNMGKKALDEARDILALLGKSFRKDT